MLLRLLSVAVIASTALAANPVCQKNEEPRSCRPMCEASCDDPKPQCAAACLPVACICQPGYVRHGGRCVSSDQCFSALQLSRAFFDSNAAFHDTPVGHPADFMGRPLPVNHPKLNRGGRSGKKMAARKVAVKKTRGQRRVNKKRVQRRGKTRQEKTAEIKKSPPPSPSDVEILRELRASPSKTVEGIVESHRRVRRARKDPAPPAIRPQIRPQRRERKEKKSAPPGIRPPMKAKSGKSAPPGFGPSAKWRKEHSRH